MGRDLLYKPQVAFVPEEEDGKDGKDGKAKGQKAKAQAPAVKAPAVKGPRDLGQVGRSALQKMTESQARAAKAHRHAYFNKDVSGVRSANLGTHGNKALRGSEEATNLKKIVLPQAIGVDHPEPEVLRGALDLMGVDGGFSPDLGSLLGRQGAWAKGQGVTAEMLKARMRQLEEMVEARKAALARMAGRSPSVTLNHAANAGGAGLDDVDDVATAGTELVQETAAQADGLHARLAKMFGVTMQ